MPVASPDYVASLQLNSLLNVSELWLSVETELLRGILLLRGFYWLQTLQDLASSSKVPEVYINEASFKIATRPETDYLTAFWWKELWQIPG